MHVIRNVKCNISGYIVANIENWLVQLHEQATLIATHGLTAADAQNTLCIFSLTFKIKCSARNDCMI